MLTGNYAPNVVLPVDKRKCYRHFLGKKRTHLLAAGKGDAALAQRRAVAQRQLAQVLVQRARLQHLKCIKKDKFLYWKMILDHDH